VPAGVRRGHEPVAQDDGSDFEGGAQGTVHEGILPT
jgi:hypothetical protein